MELGASVDHRNEVQASRESGCIQQNARVSAGADEDDTHVLRHSRSRVMNQPVRMPWWKRVEDLVIGLPALVIASPIIAAAGLATFAEDRGPVFYDDERVGVGGRIFRAYKLRTMVPGATSIGLGRLVSDRDPRITRVGRVLRRWSLDEVPQLWNVVRGDMSLVGPRPTYVEQTRRYSDHDAGRLRVKPGLTGLAQVRGRNDLPWAKRIELDLRYIDRMSLWLDLRILVETPWVILRGEGIYGRRGVTPDYGDDTS